MAAAEKVPVRGMERVPASIVLPGHGRTEAVLELARFSRWAWAMRTVGYFIHWVGATAVTAIVTFFDLHILILPVILGGAWFYQACKRQTKIAFFRGSCPRCSAELSIKPDSWISLPHPLVCMSCHFEPELHLDPAA